MKPLLFLLFFWPSIALCMTCAETFRELAPYQVYEWTREHADQAWAEIESVSLPKAKRLAMLLALAENDPAQMASRMAKLKLSDSERAELAIRIAERKPSALVSHPEALPASKAKRFDIATAAFGRIKGQEEGKDKRADEFVSLVNHLDLTEPQRYRLALMLLNYNDSWNRTGKPWLRKHLKQFNLSLSHRLAIGEMFGPEMLEFIEEFDLGKDEKLKIAQKYVAAHAQKKQGSDAREFLVPKYQKALGLSDSDLRGLFRRAWQKRDDYLAPLLNEDSDWLVVDFANMMKLSSKEKAGLLAWFYDRERDGSGYVHLSSKVIPKIVTDDPDANYRIGLAAFRGRGAINIHERGAGIHGFLSTAVLRPAQRLDLIERLLHEYGVRDLDALTSLVNHPDISQKDRIRLLRRLISSEYFRTPKRDVIEEFLKLVPGRKKEALQLMAEAGADVSALVDTVRFSRDEKLYFLMLAAQRDPEEMIGRIPVLGLRQAERFRLVQAIAETKPELVDAHIHRLDLSEQQRFEIARGMLERGRGGDQRRSELAIILQYNIADPGRRYELAKAYVKYHRTHESISEAARLTELKPRQVEALGRIPFSQDPLGELAKEGIEISENTPLETIQDHLRAYADRHPRILPKQWVDIVWDRVKKRQTGLELLRHLYELTDYDPSKPVPTDSLDVLSAVTGLDANALRQAKLSQDRLGTIYELALDLRAGLRQAPLQGVRIDPSVLRKDSFIALVQRLRDALHISGNTDEAWQGVHEGLKLSDGITADNIGALTKRAENHIVDAVQREFGSTDMKLTYEQLAALREKWGDLEPIYTLIARFKGSSQWHKEIDTLARIFEASLQNRFEDYKFTGDPNDQTDQAQARAQLSSLATDQQKAEWRRVRSRVAVFNPNGQVGAVVDPVPGAKAVVENQLVGHLALTGEANPEHVEAVRTVLATQPDPMQALAALDQGAMKGMEPPVFRDALMRAGLVLLRGAEDAEGLRRIAGAMNAWAGRLGVNVDARNDLKDIAGRVKPNRDAPVESIVFTTTVNDPKSLITIGDLVKCSSCQNYRTGGVIGTLPGYVVDANVQAIVSFNLPVASFRRPAEFLQVRQAVAEGKRIKTVWDGGRRTVTFEIENPSGQSVFVVSNPVDQAYHRQMMKLGRAADGRPGIFLERAYESPIDSVHLMQDQVASLKEEITAAIGGVAGQQITVAASRNPGGHYSDAGGGVVTGEYTVGP